MEDKYKGLGLYEETYDKLREMQKDKKQKLVVFMKELIDELYENVEWD